MRVFNENKTTELFEYNLKLGHLKQDTIIHHIPEVTAIKEQGHYETIKEYPNGGKVVKWIVDVLGREYQPERDEEEKILVYILYNEKELAQIEAEKKKTRLSELTKDLAQVQAGLIVPNIEEKKAEFRTLLNEIRVLEGKKPREIVGG